MRKFCPKFGQVKDFCEILGKSKMKKEKFFFNFILVPKKKLTYFFKKFLSSEKPFEPKGEKKKSFLKVFSIKVSIEEFVIYYKSYSEKI